MSQVPQTKSRYSQDDWSQLMTEYQASELTQRQFCERHQLAYSTFCYWRKRLLAGAARTELAATPVPLLEFPVLPMRGQTDWRLELELVLDTLSNR